MLKRLLAPRANPEPQAYAQQWPSYAEATGYCTVRGEDFDKAFSQWHQTKALPQERERASGPTPEACIANLDSRSGYVREFCLRVLTLLDSAEALKPVVMRLNDYVPINRELALQLTLKWLGELPVTTVVEALPELGAIVGQSRANHAAVHEVVDRRLAAEDGRNALVAGLKHNHAKVRRECWTRCLQKFAWTGPERVEAAMGCGDPAIARSVEQDVYALSDEALIAWFEKIHQVRAMPLRRAFLVAVRRKGLADAQTLVERALWDHSYSIRWLARHWSKDDKQDLVIAYRRVLNGPGSPRLKRYALEGLGQLGQADTADCLDAALHDASPSLRRAAIDALCNFASATRYDYLIRALKDGDMAVVRKCFEISLKTGDHLAYQDLLPIAQARSHELDFFVCLIAYAGHVSVWLDIHLASLTRFSAVGVQASLKPHIDAFLNQWARQQIYFKASQKQWADVCAWLPYETFDSQSALRFALEGEAKRMKARG